MRYLAILATAAVMLLTGCATTIRSDVTAFNAWPADLQAKTYAFEAPRGVDDTLEFRSYQVLVSNELSKLGFQQADEGQQPNLLVGMKYLTIDQPVRVIREDPFMGAPWGSPYWAVPAMAATAGAIRAGPTARSTIRSATTVSAWKNAYATSTSASCA